MQTNCVFLTLALVLLGGFQQASCQENKLFERQFGRLAINTEALLESKRSELNCIRTVCKRLSEITHLNLDELESTQLFFVDQPKKYDPRHKLNFESFLRPKARGNVIYVNRFSANQDWSPFAELLTREGFKRSGNQFISTQSVEFYWPVSRTAHVFGSSFEDRKPVEKFSKILESEEIGFGENEIIKFDFALNKGSRASQLRKQFMVENCVFNLFGTRVELDCVERISGNVKFSDEGVWDIAVKLETDEDLAPVIKEAMWLRINRFRNGKWNVESNPKAQESENEYSQKLVGAIVRNATVKTKSKTVTFNSKFKGVALDLDKLWSLLGT